MHMDAIILLGYYKNITKFRLVKNGFPENKIFQLKKENLDNLLQLLFKITEKKSNKKELNIIGMVNIRGLLVEEYIKYFTN